MKNDKKRKEPYGGFEQGPIRPPSEAKSLLIRVTRNCPWNRCTFCPVYKDTRFSLRPVEHVIMDIDTVADHVDSLKKLSGAHGSISRAQLSEAAQKVPRHEMQAFHAAVNWYAGGMRSIFIQDANSLILPPRDMIRILEHLTSRFYWVERITSYARSHTIVRIGEDDLLAMARAGLNRIHIGLESGSDKVLKKVKKGVTKEGHIKAGKKVKKAGISLSEYVMPGLGGVKLWREHATETADALNRIDPDFIRLRTLAIPNIVPLHDDWESGKFEKPTDLQIARELLLFLESLDGITSKVKSDHILNLFEEVEGMMPEDKSQMTDVVRRFLSMEPKDRCVYQVGRRLGVFRRLSDMQNSRRVGRVEQVCRENAITPENVDEMIDELMKRFI